MANLSIPTITQYLIDLNQLLYFTATPILEFYQDAQHICKLYTK